MDEVSLVTGEDIILDIFPGNVPPDVDVSEYDTGRIFGIRLFNHGSVYTIPEGISATIEGTIGDYNFSVVASVDENETNRLYFKLDESMTAVKGKAWTKVKLAKDSDQVSSCAFWLNVDKAGVEAKEVINAPGFQAQIDSAVQNYFTNTDALSLVLGNESVSKAISEGLIPYSVVWENGNIGNDGQDSDSNKAKRLRNVGYIPTSAVTHIRNCAKVVSSKIYVMYYDSSYVYKTYEDLGATEVETDYLVDQSYSYMRLTMIKYSSSSHTTQLEETPQDAYSNVVLYTTNEAFVYAKLYESDVEAMRRGYLPAGVFPFYEQGNIGWDGEDTDSSKAKRVRTSNFLSTKLVKNVIVTDNSHIRVYVECYSAPNVSGYQSWYFQDDGAIIDDTYPYVRLIFIRYPDAAHSSQDDILPSDIYNSVILAGKKFETSSGQYVDGIRAKLAEVNDRLWTLEGGTVPAVYTDHIAAQITEINRLSKTLTTGEQFIFATDYHGVEYGNTYYNHHQMKSLINEIVRGTSISIIINGGDVLNSNQGEMTRTTFLRYMRKFCQYFTGDDYTTTLFVAGNHDLGSDGRSGGVTDPIITENDLFVNSGLASISDKLVFDEHTPFNYYYDSDGGKIRYIVLVTPNLAAWGFSNTSFYENWLIRALSSLPDGWTAVVAYHWPFANDGTPVTATNNLAAIMAAYNARMADTDSNRYDFTNANGVAPIIIGGHQHLDKTETLTPITGFNIIVAMTTTACWSGEYDPNTDRSEGTVNEEAFDVFTINTTARTIDATRIGGGSSRHWSY